MMVVVQFLFVILPSNPRISLHVLNQMWPVIKLKPNRTTLLAETELNINQHFRKDWILVEIKIGKFFLKDKAIIYENYHKFNICTCLIITRIL